MSVDVQVDDRESTGPVVDLLNQFSEFRVTVTRLKLGDYLVEGKFLFERKTLPDLVISIVSGRLFTQAMRLAATSLRPAIILEGTSQDLAASGMSWIQAHTAPGCEPSVSLVQNGPGSGNGIGNGGGYGGFYCFALKP